MNPKYWFGLAALAAGMCQLVACSSDFSSCEQDRSCASGGAAGLGQVGASGGAGGGKAGSGTSGARADITADEAGAGGLSEPSGGAGESGASSAAGGSTAGGSAAVSGAAGGGAQGGSGAGGSAGGGAGLPLDRVPPSILGITPINGRTMLTTLTDRIVITFSEPMNQATAQAAYAPSNTAVVPVFSWNSAGTELTIDPKLPYPQSSDPGAAAVPFTFSISTAAEDLAGNHLTAGVSNWSFTLLREIRQSFGYNFRLGGNVTAVSSGSSFVLAGDSTKDSAVRGLMSYDISALPVGIQVLESAVLTGNVESIAGNPFGLFGNLLIQSVSFASPDSNAFETPVLHDLGPLILAAGSHAVGDAISKDVLVALKDDYEKRVERGNLSQYRMAFVLETNGDATADQVSISHSASNNHLTVTYLYP